MVGRLGVSMEEALDMSWSEFQLRLFGFNENQKWEIQLTREVAYQVHCLNYLMSKQKPPRKEKFWPIDKKKSVMSPEVQAEFIRQQEAYKKAVNG